MIQVEGFNLRIVAAGDHYGRNDCLRHDGPPMVEFYCARADAKFGERGQFVSRYYVKTITDNTYPYGLCLDGGVPEWSISTKGMKEVLDYLKELT
jgi:hypothetical protein